MRWQPKQACWICECNVCFYNPQQIPSANFARVKWNAEQIWQYPCWCVVISNENAINGIEKCTHKHQHQRIIANNPCFFSWLLLNVPIDIEHLASFLYKMKKCVKIVRNWQFLNGKIPLSTISWSSLWRALTFRILIPTLRYMPITWRPAITIRHGSEMMSICGQFL